MNALETPLEDKKKGNKVRPFKIVLMGDAAVGKTSILRRIADNQFTDNYVSTIGIDFRFINVLTHHLQFWDTAGQTHLRPNVDKCSMGADVILYVYDVTNKESFESLHALIEDVKGTCSPNTFHYVVGNKKDKGDSVISDNEVDSLVTKYNLKRKFEVSAKEGESAVNMLLYVVTYLIDI